MTQFADKVKPYPGWGSQKDPSIGFSPVTSTNVGLELMITSLIEMLELPNFGHMTASTI